MVKWADRLQFVQRSNGEKRFFRGKVLCSPAVPIIVQNSLISQHELLTFPQARKWVSERCEQTSKWTCEWPSTYVGILGCSEPLCLGSGANLSRDNEPGVNVKLVRAGKKENDAGRKYNTTGKGTQGFWRRYPLDTEETSGELYHHFPVVFKNTSVAKYWRRLAALWGQCGIRKSHSRYCLYFINHIPNWYEGMFYAAKTATAYTQSVIHKQ